MVNTVNKIPSINLPLTNEQGVIHPIWYEFLRSFISSVGEGEGGTTADNTVIAGSGISGTGAVSTVNIGQGEGMVINANDIAVDIIHQVNAQAAAEDEILIADASDQSRIRKTSLRDVAALSVANPGGANTQIQFNSNGIFGGDSGFTTDGAGSVNIVGDLDVDSININGSTLSTPDSSTQMIFNVPAGGLNQFLFAQSGTGSSGTTMELRGLRSSTTMLLRSDQAATNDLSNCLLSFATNNSAAEWSMGLYDSQDDDFVLANGTDINANQIFTVDRGDDYFTHNSNMRRKTIASITASTTQTQGQGALTADVNQVSTVTNANDTVTLPGAQAGSRITVINDGANTLQVFPASGDNLGAGVNSSTTITAGNTKSFVAFDTTNWEVEVNTEAASSYTDEQAQDAVGAMVDTTLVYTDATPLLSRAALTGDVTASVGSNATTVVLPSSATVATDDKVYIFDTSASDVKKYVTTQSIRDLAPTSTPAFSVYRSTNQTGIVTATLTKVQLDTENFDTISCFDSTTNYRYTPNVAGKYLILGSIRYTAFTSGSNCFCLIYKNGSTATQINTNPATTGVAGAQSYAILDMNGSTDYIELYTRQDTGSDRDLTGSSVTTYLHGIRII